jgi:predicted DNA-binding transcriptional regulator YafY
LNDKELLAQRIVDILTKLNAGETLKTHQLANEYNVSIRTIQRDINSRLAFLPIERSGQDISLSPNALGKLSAKDILNFAQLSGIGELFPSLDSKFIVSLLRQEFNAPYRITGNEFELNQSSIKEKMTKIEWSITNQELCNFSYKGKQYRNVAPYKLINHNQVWYLMAVDQGKLKSFHLEQLQSLMSNGSKFTPDPEITEQINQSDSIYIANEKSEVVVKVSSEVAHYFKRRQLLPEQRIDKELESGELIVSSKIAYDLEIVPLIKYWMPHLQVISPNVIHQRVVDDIKNYLQSLN